MSFLIVSRLFQTPAEIELPTGVDDAGERVFKTYRFNEVAPGVFGAEFEDEEHIARLLSIPEGFKLSIPAAPARSLVQPHAEPVPEPVSEPEPTQTDEPSPAAIQPSYDDMTEDEARAAFESMFGRKAHHKTSLEKIVAALKSGPAAEPTTTQEG